MYQVCSAMVNRPLKGVINNLSTWSLLKENLDLFCCSKKGPADRQNVQSLSYGGTWYPGMWYVLRMIDGNEITQTVMWRFFFYYTYRMNRKQKCISIRRVYHLFFGKRCRSAPFHSLWIYSMIRCVSTRVVHKLLSLHNNNKFFIELHF